MRTLLLLLVAIFFSLPAWAQENDFDLRETDQQEPDTIKDIIAVLEDSSAIENVRSMVTRIAIDSLNNYVEVSDIMLDSTFADQIRLKAFSKGKALVENVTDIEITRVAIDSMTIHDPRSKVQSESMKALESELGRDIPQVEIDSTFIKKLEKEALERAGILLRDTDELKALEIPADSELSDLQNYKDAIEKTREEIRQAAVSKDLKQKMISQGKKYIMEHADKIQQVQSKMDGLKQKYSSVLNSNDLSSAVKRTSLKEASLWKRLVLGGNFNVSKTNPLTIDLSPLLGYKLNALFEAGIAGTYRAQFKADKSGLSPDQEKVYGYSVFASHMVFKNFFGYLEGERMNTAKPFSETHTNEWDQSLLVGIGRKFKVAKWLELQGLVLFNVLHDNGDELYNGPVVFKTALRLRK